MEEIIYSYTREQALADGVLIDVSELAKEAGFTIPVAVTDTVWFNYIKWTQDDNKQQTYQEYRNYKGSFLQNNPTASSYLRF